MIALGAVVKARLRIRSTTFSFAWVETAIVLGLALAPPPWVILSTGVGIACVSLVNRLTAIKTVFGIAKHTLVAGGATLVIMLLGQRWPPDGLWNHLVLLGVVYLAAAVLDDLLAIPVIALASGTRVVRQFRNHLDLRLAGFAVRFVVAALTLIILQADQRLLLAVPPLVLSLHLAYSARIRGRTEQQAWQRLARTTDALNVVDLDEVLTTAVTQAAELFSADEVEIELRDGRPHRTRWHRWHHLRRPDRHAHRRGRHRSSPRRSKATTGPSTSACSGCASAARCSSPSGSSTPCAPSPPRSAPPSATPRRTPNWPGSPTSTRTRPRTTR